MGRLQRESCLGDRHDGLQHGRSEGNSRIGITSRVIVGLGNSDMRDDAINDVHGPSLAAADDTDTRRAGVSHLHATALGEFAGGITHHFDNARDALVFRPSIHDGSVIDTVDENFLNSCFFKCVLLFQVPGNLS
jgi:hypothetical protein